MEVNFDYTGRDFLIEWHIVLFQWKNGVDSWIEPIRVPHSRRPSLITTTNCIPGGPNSHIDTKPYETLQIIDIRSKISIRSLI